MATRAYFRTQDTALTERFLQVPAGTFARLEAFHADFSPSPEQLEAAQGDADFAKYLALKDDRDLALAEAQQVFGLGRVPAAMQLGACGDFFSDLGRSEDLLARMGFAMPEGLTMADMGGLYWV